MPFKMGMNRPDVKRCKKSNDYFDFIFLDFVTDRSLERLREGENREPGSYPQYRQKHEKLGRRQDLLLEENPDITRKDVSEEAR
jgi:hypothetical protein